MIQMYYKIPPKYVEELGLTNTLVRHPDGNYLAARAVMARIHPDIDRALEMTGGIALTPEQARDDQMGIASYPLPSDNGQQSTENADNADNTQPTTYNE